MKKLFLLLGTLFFVVACGEASDVRSEMQMMNRYTNGLMSATSAEEFQTSAQHLREFTVKAMNMRPSTVKSDEEYQGYQQAMQKFIDVVDQADQLAKDGKLDEAKALSQQLFELKKDGHRQYKNH